MTTPKKKAAPVKKAATKKVVEQKAKKRGGPPKKRIKKYPVGEQAADHDILLTIPMRFFGKREQVVQSVGTMLHQLKVIGYEPTGDAVFMLNGVLTKATPVEPGKIAEGSP